MGHSIGNKVESKDGNTLMDPSNQNFLKAAYQIAKFTNARALFLSLDSLDQAPKARPPKGCSIILVTWKRPEEMKAFFPDGKAAPYPLLHLPRVEMTRTGRIKMAVMLALSGHLIAQGDKILFATGIPGGDRLDCLLFLDTEKESEILTTQGIQGISESVKPEVFQEILSVALELATRGREGKPVGTIFVLGDEEKVLHLSKQMIINPFRGYSDEERNVLTKNLRETLREFAAIDGAMVISRDGLVMTAGCYLGASSEEANIPRGLGSRHIAAAVITALTRAIAIVISESTGDVRIFKNGKILMELEKQIKIPMIS